MLKKVHILEFFVVLNSDNDVLSAQYTQNSWHTLDFELGISFVRVKRSALPCLSVNHAVEYLSMCLVNDVRLNVWLCNLTVGAPILASRRIDNTCKNS